MGGIKRKIPLEKIEKKDSRAVAFSKRSKGLYSKASELCLLSGGQIAIIATPVSSKSNVSFYSFGHSSVDGVVDAFLSNQRPRDDLGLGFWWNDESLARSDNPEELRDAMNSMSKMLQDLKALRFDEDVKKKGILHATHQNQTLDLQSSSSTLCIHDDPTANLEGFNKNTEEQILSIPDNNNNNSGLTGSMDGCNQGFGLEQIFDFVKSEEGPSMSLETDYVSMVTMNQNQVSSSKAVEGGELVMHRDCCNQELGLDQIFDFMKSEKGPSMSLETDDVSMVTSNQNPVSSSEAVEGEELVMHRDWYDNNLHLSDFDENQIISISDNNSNNNNDLPGNESWCDQDLDLDDIIDFETNCESLLMNLEMMNDISEAVEEGGSEIHKDLDEENLHFSDIFNELASITAL